MSSHIAQNFLEQIYALQPTQAKKVATHFDNNPAAKTALERFLERYQPLIASEHVGGLQGLAKSYSQMLDEIIACRLHFLREGNYPLSSAEEAFDRVYNNAQQMWPYMLGLAVSQFLWPTHYALLEFYKAAIQDANPSGRFLEVGSGHGIFVSELCDVAKQEAQIDVVDISAVSIEMSKQVLDSVSPETLSRVHFTESDIIDYTPGQPYDFIGMGEVLEHVESPHSILRSLRSLLSDEGRLYISTCANCPAIDHIYLFNNIDEIQKMIRECGYEIEREVVLPSEDKPQEFIERYKLDIVYGAVLRKHDA